MSLDFTTDTGALRAYAQFLESESGELNNSVTSIFENDAYLPPSAFGHQISFLPFDEMARSYEEARQTTLKRLDLIRRALENSSHNLKVTAGNYERADADNAAEFDSIYAGS